MFAHDFNTLTYTTAFEKYYPTSLCLSTEDLI